MKSGRSVGWWEIIKVVISIIIIMNVAATVTIIITIATIIKPDYDDEWSLPVSQWERMGSTDDLMLNLSLVCYY